MLRELPQWGKGLKWLKAAAGEILEGAKKAIAELDMARVEKLIQMLLDAKSKKILVVGVGEAVLWDELLLCAS